MPELRIRQTDLIEGERNGLFLRRQEIDVIEYGMELMELTNRERNVEYLSRIDC